MDPRDLHRLNLTDLLTLYKSGKLKPSEYIQRIITRQQQFQDHNYYTYFNPQDIIAKAMKADQNYKNNTARPLEGLPISFKDNIDIQNEPNTACTPALSGFRPSHTAKIAERLLLSGAINVGRCNMHELAAGVTTINTFTGSAQNFYNRSHSCGGSSGGCAGAVSADIVPAAIGTDTGGSIRIPASNCGLFGYKPTIDRWPAMYGIKMTNLRDTIGPLVRRAEDIVYLDTAVTGETYGEVRRPQEFRIGVPRKHFWEELENNIRSQAEGFLEELRLAGFELIETEGFDIQEDLAISPLLYNYEVLKRLQDYLTDNQIEISVEEVVSQISTPNVKRFFERLLQQNMTEDEYQFALRIRQQLIQKFEKYKEENQLDCWIFPTTKIPSQPLEWNDDSV